MGALWVSGRSFITMLGEVVGHKSGVALTLKEMRRFLREREDLRDVWPNSLDSGMRVRAEVIEEVTTWLLYRVGNIPTPSTIPPDIELLHEIRGTPKNRVATDRIAREG